MNLSETAHLLSFAAALDQRSIGEADVQAWQALLVEEGVEYSDALAAVRLHYRRSSRRVMPFDVIELAREVHRVVLERGGQVDLPAGLSQAQEREYRVRYWALIRSDEAMDRERAHAVVDRTFGVDRSVDAIPMPPELRAAVEAAFSLSDEPPGA